MTLWALRHAHWVQASAWPLAICAMLLVLMRLFSPDAGGLQRLADLPQLRVIDTLPGRAPGALVSRYAVDLPGAHDADLRLFFIVTTPQARLSLGADTLYERRVAGGPYAIIPFAPALVRIPVAARGAGVLVLETDGLMFPATAPPPVFFGPAALVQQAYQTAWLRLIALPLVVLGSALALGGVLAASWLGRRADHAALLGALMMFIGAARLGTFLVPDLAIAGPALRASNAAYLVQLALMPIWVARFLGHALPRWFWALLALAGVVTLGILLAPAIMLQPGMVKLAFGLAPASLAACLVTLLPAAWRGGSADARLLLFLICSPALIILSLGGGFTSTSRLVVAGGGPVFTFAMVVIFGYLYMARYWRAARVQAAAHEGLEQELRVAQASLAAALNQQHEQAQRLLIQAERERLMRDLHDGVSGRLASAVMLCSHGDTELSTVEDSLREALAELRLVITAFQDFHGDLAQAIGSFLPHLERLARPFGVRLDGDLAMLSAVPDLTPGKIQHVLRILQEAVMNAARHAGATHVRITADAGRLTVRDNGRGLVAGQGSGLGMRTMQARAREIGGALRVASPAEGGTEVTLMLPEACDGLALPGTSAGYRPGKSIRALLPDRSV
jgi:signal transduction histidine kinase